MKTQDDKTLSMLRQLIKEVKTEMKDGKVLTESKKPVEQKQTLKEYVTKNITKILYESD